MPVPRRSLRVTEAAAASDDVGIQRAQVLLGQHRVAGGRWRAPADRDVGVLGDVEAGKAARLGLARHLDRAHRAIGREDRDAQLHAREPPADARAGGPTGTRYNFCVPPPMPGGEARRRVVAARPIDAGIPARAPLHARARPRLPDRRPGAGAAPADAAPARPGRGPLDRGLHLRLSRLAARHLRPGALAGAGGARVPPRPVRAGRERGPGGDGGLGIPAGGPLRRAALRRRLRDLVRQGPRRRPLLRRAQARQLRGRLAHGRRAGAGGRRSGRQVLLDRAPERARADPLRDPGPESRRRAGVPRLRALRLRALALLGQLDRDEVPDRHGRQRALGRDRSRAREHPHAGRLRAARGSPHRLAEPSAGGRAPPLPAAASRGAGLRAREWTRPAGLPVRAPAARDRHHRQGVPRRAAGARRARHRRSGRANGSGSRSTRSP